MDLSSGIIDVMLAIGDGAPTPHASVILHHDENCARQGRADPERQHESTYNPGQALTSGVVEKGRDAQRIHEY
jgi:hypothetical protein